MDEKNAPHVGGNTWAGGTGGRDTAGLGGKGGPYRLDAGHDVYQLSDEEKNSVPEDVSSSLILQDIPVVQEIQSVVFFKNASVN